MNVPSMSKPSRTVLGIFPSLGGSIQSQNKDGRQALFLDYYIPTYFTQFDEVRYFSYEDENLQGENKMVFFPNRFHLHRYVYAWLMPFLYWKAIKTCSVIRVMQANGAIPALICKFFWRIPYIMTYGYDYTKFTQIEGHSVKAWFLNQVLPVVLKYSSRIIVTTDDLRNQVQKHVRDMAKVVLIPNAVDLERFKPQSSIRVSGLPIKILFVGRLERQKNLFFLLDVIAGLRVKQPILLTIVGEGRLRSKLEENVKARSLPVQLVGAVPYQKIVQYYQESDIFISTSLAEGHPKSLIEAMSCGMICIVSNCEGNHSLIKDGFSGILLALQESLWITSLGKIIDNIDCFRCLGEQAREVIKENFDISQTLNREVALLMSLVEKR